MGAPLILFFNPFFTEFPDTSGLECRRGCEFTSDRARMAEADAVVIHLPACQRIWEARKYPGQLWVAWSLESDVTIPMMRSARFMRHFDLTMTYRRDADVWCPYLPPTAFPPSPADRLLAPAPPKRESVPAVLFQSSRYDRSRRYPYLHELMKRVRVDSYGKITPNQKVDGPDTGRQTKLDVISRYKFCLSFENSLSVDYVSEKFFDPLVAGTVPVYRGASNVAEFAPGEKCFINADDFSGPAELAEYLNFLNGNDAAYQEYFRWKSAGFSAGFQKMMQIASREPFCRLCDIVARRTLVRRAQHRSGDASFVRPLHLWQWHPREIRRRLRKAQHVAGGTWSASGP